MQWFNGTAWEIEGLVWAYDALKDDRFLKEALRIAKAHHYDENLGLWKIVDADGNYAPTLYDLTFNHQLWFGALFHFK